MKSNTKGTIDTKGTSVFKVLMFVPLVPLVSLVFTFQRKTP